MGFSIAGYPTRHHKRRMLPHPDKRPVYYHHHWAGEGAARKRARVVGSGSVSSLVEMTNVSAPSLLPHHKHKAMTLQDLPAEIIQRIFVLANDVSALPLVSRRLHACLRPSATLLHHILYERFLFDPRTFGIHRCGDSDTLLASPELFEHRLVARHFLAHFAHFRERIHAFAPRSLVPHLRAAAAGTLAPDFTFDLATLAQGEFDLPHYFYHHFAATFAQPHLLGGVLRYFSGADLSRMLDSALRWFFEEQTRYGVDALAAFCAALAEQLVRTRTHITSALPLHTALLALYLAPTRDVDMLLQMHSTDSEHDSTDPTVSRYELVRALLRMFYGPQNPHAHALLANPDLWRALHDVSDIRLIDIFEKAGAVGHYNFA